MKHMTDEEQQLLMKYLPLTDTAKFPERLVSLSLCYMPISNFMGDYYITILFCYILQP